MLDGERHLTPIGRFHFLLDRELAAVDDHFLCRYVTIKHCPKHVPLSIVTFAALRTAKHRLVRAYLIKSSVHRVHAKGNRNANEELSHRSYAQRVPPRKTFAPLSVTIFTMRPMRFSSN